MKGASSIRYLFKSGFSECGMKKPMKERGKIRMSKYFQKFEKGDMVSVIREPSIAANFPERIQGRTGMIEGKVGRSYFVRVRQKSTDKRFIIEPIHLKKINQ
jgi:ribosomal protein L21E